MDLTWEELAGRAEESAADDVTASVSRFSDDSSDGLGGVETGISVCLRDRLDNAAGKMGGEHCCRFFACGSVGDAARDLWEDRADRLSLDPGAGRFEGSVRVGGGIFAAGCCAERLDRV